jgi:bacterioferritin-associated ferredoxin
MYVCICKAVCEKRVREAIDSGAATVSAVGRACGAGTDCGSCHDTIEGLLDETDRLPAEADHDSRGEPRPHRVSLPMLVAV